MLFHNKRHPKVMDEKTLGITVKAAGGRWNRKKKLWEIPYQDALDLGLENRIIWEEDQHVSHITGVWQKYCEWH